MELKYLIARWNGKHVLFVISPEEEMILMERMESENMDFHVFISGLWIENETTQHKLERWVKKIDQWVVSENPIESEFLSQLLCQAHVDGTHLIDIDAFLLQICSSVPANSIELIHLLSSKGVHQNILLKAYVHLKYALEPLVAFLIALILSPIMFFVALAVKFTSVGPVIYSQERVGLNGKIFRIYKFRSMLVDAEKGKPTWAAASRTDPNLTSIGGFLRASHLDELPQLWNIIHGDVSFIGPRPERPEFVQQLSESISLFKLRTLVKPGITGWAQINQGYANSVRDSERKLELDFFYIMKHCPSLDLKIAFKTISVLVSGGTEQIKRAKAMKLTHAIHKPLKTMKVTS